MSKIVFNAGKKITTEYDRLMDELIQLQDYVNFNFIRWNSTRGSENGFIDVKFYERAGGHEIWVKIVPQFNVDGTKKICIIYKHTTPTDNIIRLYNESDYPIINIVLSTITVIEAPYIDREKYKQTQVPHTVTVRLPSDRLPINRK